MEMQMIDTWIRVFFTALALAAFLYPAHRAGIVAALNKPYQQVAAAFSVVVGLTLIVSIIGIIWTA